MNLTDVGIAAIDLVFAVAVLAVVSCLVYLVYVAIREHAEMRSVVRPSSTGMADLSEARARRLVKSLRPSAVHQRVSSS